MLEFKRKKPAGQIRIHEEVGNKWKKGKSKIKKENRELNTEKTKNKEDGEK